MGLQSLKLAPKPTQPHDTGKHYADIYDNSVTYKAWNDLPTLLQEKVSGMKAPPSTGFLHTLAN